MIELRDAFELRFRLQMRLRCFSAGRRRLRSRGSIRLHAAWHVERLLLMKEKEKKNKKGKEKEKGNEIENENGHTWQSGRVRVSRV